MSSKKSACTVKIDLEDRGKAEMKEKLGAEEFLNLALII